MINSNVKLIECPRDAMQGMSQWISTDVKLNYLKTLLKVGFDTIDFGSFVSPKAVPQMKDTAEIISKIEEKHGTKLLAIVVNERGAEEASAFDQIDQLGYPLSISNTFQTRNSGKSILESMNVLDKIQAICSKNNKDLVIYVSMGFGNPYGDKYDEEVLLNFLGVISTVGARTISIADTVGIATDKQVKRTLHIVKDQFKGIEIGAHLHSRIDKAEDKIKAILDAGIDRIDSVIRGFGGCPFAEDELVGNIPTEKVIKILKEREIPVTIDEIKFKEGLTMSNDIF